MLIQPRRHLFTSLRQACLHAGDAQCVWSHQSSISSSYERKHGSARSPIFTSVKTRRVKLVKLETNYKQKEKSIEKLTRRPQFLQGTLAQLSSVQDGFAQLGSVKVGSTQATFREWLCATGSAQVGSARVCSAHNVLCTNCAARFLTKVVCASCIVPGCCAQVALCKLLHASALCKLLCASALSKLLCASALRQLLRACACALCKLVCASCSAQVLCASALCKLLALRKCCRSCGNVLRVLFLYFKVAIFQPELRECAPRTTFVLESCDFPAGAAGARSAYYVCT